MEQDVVAFYKLLEAGNVPVRYTHNQVSPKECMQVHSCCIAPSETDLLSQSFESAPLSQIF